MHRYGLHAEQRAGVCAAGVCALSWSLCTELESATSHLLVVELSMQGCTPCVVARDPMSQAWGAPEQCDVLVALGRR